MYGQCLNQLDVRSKEKNRNNLYLRSHLYVRFRYFLTSYILRLRFGTKYYKVATEIGKHEILTRRLVNVRSHMMFRPAIIYIFDLTVF